jgi:putative transposase
VSRSTSIRPGRTVANCFIGSFNGRLAGRVPEPASFATLAEARAQIEQLRHEYNTERPQSSLGDRAPTECAALLIPEDGHYSIPILRS